MVGVHDDVMSLNIVEFHVFSFDHFCWHLNIGNLLEQ